MDQDSVSKQTSEAIEGQEVLSGNHTTLAQVRGNQGQTGQCGNGEWKGRSTRKRQFQRMDGIWQQV